MPADIALKAMNQAHRAILALSGGRLGWTVANMPVLELTTTGRESGKRRSVMLTSPLQEDDTIVIVASRGGDDQHPAWFLNLRDVPDVTVKWKGGEPKAMKAKVATKKQRERMWPLITDEYSGYAGYQKRTEREIPLVLLEPA